MYQPTTDLTFREIVVALRCLGLLENSVEIAKNRTKKVKVDLRLFLLCGPMGTWVGQSHFGDYKPRNKTFYFARKCY